MSRADALLTEMCGLELHEMFAPDEPVFEHSLTDVIASICISAFIIGGGFWIVGIFG